MVIIIMTIEKDKELFQKYCKNHKYYPLILPQQKRIIAIGDLHGDYQLMIRCLRLAKVIDSNNKWIGGDTYIVQVGDQLDSCRPTDKLCNDPKSEINRDTDTRENKAEDIRILEYMTELNKEAEQHNGAVISLIGNHEIMNVNGNMNYVSYNDISKFKNYKDRNNMNLVFKSALEARIHAFKPGNEYAELLACTRLPVVIIGSFLFVHAGLINDFLQLMDIKNRDDLYNISYVLRKWLLGLINKDYVVNIINSSKQSLFWDRILGKIPKNMSNKHPDCVKYLQKSLEIFNVDKMVIGHTPGFVSNTGINDTCDGKLWRIDFGGSFAFDKFKNGTEYRIPQVLEIINDTDINILY